MKEDRFDGFPFTEKNPLSPPFCKKETLVRERGGEENEDDPEIFALHF